VQLRGIGSYEISHGWNQGKGVVAVRIHELKNAAGESAKYGANPLGHVTFNESGKKLSAVASIKNSFGNNGKEIYARIRDNVSVTTNSGE